MVGSSDRNMLAAGDVLGVPGVEQVVVPHSYAEVARHADHGSMQSTRGEFLDGRVASQGELSRSPASLDEAKAIKTLPNELLVYVFELSQPTADARDAASWLGRLYLCRRWYHLITSMPRFWRDIHVSSHPEWLELCLSRCAGMSVDVYFTGRFSLQATVPTFIKHGELIRGITYTVVRPSWVSDIAQLLSMPLPSLQKLDISLVTKSTHLAEIDSEPENLVHLRTLKLRSCYAPEDPAVYSSLSSLDIGRCSWDIDFELLVDALVTTNNLCELVLSDCFDRWHNFPHGFARENPPRQSPVVLSRLRVLQLITVPAELASHLLARISVPNAEHITVHAGSYITSRNVRSVWDVFPVHTAAFFPICSTATSLRLDTHTCNTADYSVTAQSTDRYMHIRVHRGWGSNVTREIDGLLSVFGGAPVTRLSLRETRGVSAPVWERVFSSFPLLQYMHACLCDELFSALNTVSQQRPTGAVCCPDLATLTTSNHSRVSDTTFAVILSALRTRDARDTRLDKLELYLTHASKEVWQSSEHQQFEAELRTLVKDLDYHTLS